LPLVWLRHALSVRFTGTLDFAAIAPAGAMATAHAAARETAARRRERRDMSGEFLASDTRNREIYDASTTDARRTVPV
jgi:hypothetical protein